MSDYTLEGVIRLRDEASKSAQTTAANVSKLESVLKTASAALTTFGVVKAAQAVVKLGELGAQAERTERGFETISGGSAAAADNLDAMMRATDGAISRTAAMAVANQMMQMGLADNAEELERNAEMAVRLGRAMGVDATTAMQNWNAMMANQSIPRLDTFGISSGRVRVKIEELMAATVGLTREEAFQLAVFEEGAAAMARLGDATEDSALQIEQSQAALADLKNEIGMAFSNAVANGEGAVGKFTRAWGDNLRIVRESTEGLEGWDKRIAMMRYNVAMLQESTGMLPWIFGKIGEALWANNTAFDEYRAQQQAAAAETARWSAQAEYYNQIAEQQRQATLDAATAANDSRVRMEEYTTAIQNGQTATDDYRWSQLQANEATAAAETAFLNAAAALDEMSEAALARNELDLLKASLDAGTISQDQYRAATEAVLTEFGLLTPAEESAQGALDTLRQLYIDGKISADAYALAVATIKANIDALESKTIEVKTIYTEEHRAVGSGTDYRDRGSYNAQGGSSRGGWDVVGELGPELRYQQPGTRVIDNQTSQQITNNQIINLYGAINAGWIVSQARQSFVR